MRKTSNLSMAGMGAYDRLLDWYYSNSSPIPNDWEQVFRICGAVVPPDQDIVRVILPKFFILETDGWHNDKADEELAKRKEISDKRKAAQAEGQKTKERKKGTSVPSNVPSNVPTSTSTRGISKDIPPISPLEAEMYFTRVWAVYPGRGKKGAKGAAYKGEKQPAFKKFHALLKTEINHEEFTRELIRAAYLYTDFLDRSGYPSKHLTTWLNGQCWKDDYSSTDGSVSGGACSNAQALAEGVRRTLRDDGPEGSDIGGVGVQTIPSDE